MTQSDAIDRVPQRIEGRSGLHEHDLAGIVRYLLRHVLDDAGRARWIEAVAAGAGHWAVRFGDPGPGWIAIRVGTRTFCRVDTWSALDGCRYLTVEVTDDHGGWRTAEVPLAAVRCRDVCCRSRR